MAAEHPELVVAFMKGMIKVGRWANEHQRAAAAILDKQTFYRDVAATYEGIKPIDLVPNLSPQNLVSVEIGKDFMLTDFMLSHGYIKNDFDVRAWAAPEFLEHRGRVSDGTGGHDGFAPDRILDLWYIGIRTSGHFKKEQRMKRVLLTVAMLAWSLASAVGAEADRQAADEAAIRKAVESYVAAFNQGDAKALAAMWSPEAVYTNPLSGEQVVGRAEIEKQFAAIFADAKGAKLEAKTDSIQFVSPSVGIEHGTAKVIVPDQAPEESEYTAVYVKRDDQWLLDRVTEEDVLVIPSHYEQLKDLEWMIGRWVDQDDDATVVTECNWTKNNNFMTRSFTVQIRDRIDMAGMQIIGWDPAAKQIRSWVFDSDGGFGQGTWTKKDKRWYIQQTGVLPDGRKSTAVNIITYIDDNTCTLQSVNRTVDGELLPNIDEVKITKE
jgi:uncharacterized protein (TIGR02246 family)